MDWVDSGRSDRFEESEEDRVAITVDAEPGAEVVAEMDEAGAAAAVVLSKVSSLKLFSISSFLEEVFITRWVLGLVSRERFSKPVLRRRETLWWPAMLLVWLVVLANLV